MERRCPNCKHEYSPEEYKCKNCGELFWRTKELFEKHCKEHLKKTEEQPDKEEVQEIPKKKTAKANLIGILGGLFIVSFIIHGIFRVSLGVVPEFLLILGSYWVIKQIALSCMEETKSDNCPDCNPNEDYKCKSCGQVFWRSKEFFEKHHKEYLRILEKQSTREEANKKVEKL